MRVYVGCCGFPVSRSKYFKAFPTVEVQQTFYKIPRLSTLSRWKEEAPDGFIFNMKAFQGVTHPYTSPTWKRYGALKGRKENYGLLQPTREVTRSWEETLEAYKALGARVCLIQTPPSFKDTKDNIRNAKKFFRGIDRQGVNIAFEPRGWGKAAILSLCEEFDLIHTTDPFASTPIYLKRGGIAYFRLHGSPPGRKLYNYKYTKDDLAKLKGFLEDLNGRVDEVYVMFNNVYMLEDAKALNELLR